MSYAYHMNLEHILSNLETTMLVSVKLVIYDVAVIMTSLVDRFNTDLVVMVITQ